jgi:hypothetical protein
MLSTLAPFGAYAFARAKEPSTWAGLGVFFGLLAQTYPAAGLLAVAAAVCAAAAAAMRDPGGAR